MSCDWVNPAPVPAGKLVASKKPRAVTSMSVMGVNRQPKVLLRSKESVPDCQQSFRDGIVTGAEAAKHKGEK
jgi:hypothetical protein